jgi:hypothetical protein
MWKASSRLFAKILYWDDKCTLISRAGKKGFFSLLRLNAKPRSYITTTSYASSEIHTGQLNDKLEDSSDE